MKSREEFFREAQRRQLQYQAAAHLHLKPCPFCNAAAELRMVFARWLVECPNWEECGASGPHKPSPDTAIVAWNRRAAEFRLHTALTETVVRLTGYDWNADPDSITRLQGEAFAAIRARTEGSDV